ncbi:MAG: helix-turn-helix domain-containing protein [Planctomycetes bacterium]|nr:helix-turn-helix domain-containing protein [Planctomycetota bacterium]
MPKSGEFYSFDEVLKRLKIDDQRLKKLVSEGEIRAFREGSEMKFRRSDIDNMDKTRPVTGTEDATAAIDLSAGGGAGQSETLTDDLIFDEGDDVGSHEAGMATAEISSQDTFVDEGVGMSTEPLEVDDATQEVGAKGKKPAKKGGGAAPPPPPAKPRRVMEEEKPTEVGWCVALSLGALLLVGCVFVSLDMSKSDRPDAASSGFSKWLGETFGSK